MGDKRQNKSTLDYSNSPRTLVAIIGLFTPLGCATAIYLIRCGYRVLGLSTRNLDIKRVKQLLASFPQECIRHLSYRLIISLTAQGFAEKFKEARYIMYMASPLVPSSTPTPDELTKANVKVLPHIIEGAKLTTSIKRIIFVTSITAYFTPEELGEWDTLYIDQSPQPPHNHHNEPVAFAGNRAFDFLVADLTNLLDTEANFDFVYFMVPDILGPSPLKMTAAEFHWGSNGKLLDHLLGKGNQRLLGTSVHIDDAAKCLARSVFTMTLTANPYVTEGRYIITGGPANWSNAINIVKRHRPELIGSMFATMDVPARVYPCEINNTESKVVFNHLFKDFEEQVLDTVDFYASLLKNNPPE
ncbi:hypothetical protein ONZ43_g6065 [Nemania bipapillata]|uniref:Uncharacterized protein n=1 Tax=Nemania bipapillata TaxID=110536 RepID=A0ACC2I3B2_9PEZI|nr:hypothetical protein ONZ43_g6065 [Nemania bipapillata]